MSEDLYLASGDDNFAQIVLKGRGRRILMDDFHRSARQRVRKRANPHLVGAENKVRQLFRARSCQTNGFDLCLTCRLSMTWAASTMVSNLVPSSEANDCIGDSVPIEEKKRESQITRELNSAA